MSSPVQLKLFYSGENCVVRVQNVQESDQMETTSGLDIGICQDVSGSMSTSVSSQDGTWLSSKMKLCQEAIRFVISKLGSNRLGIVTFDSYVKKHLPLERVLDRDATNHSIDSLFPGSCTNLSGGMFEALQMMESSDTTRIKYLLVFTDGCANVGITEQEPLINLVKKGVEKCPGLKLIIMGYGNDCNSSLLQSIVEAVDGSYHQLNSAEDIPKAMGEEFGTALQTRQQCLKFKYDAAEMTPVFNHDDSEEGICHLGDLLQEEERSFLFRVHDTSKTSPAEVSLEFVDCSTGEVHEVSFNEREKSFDPILVSDAENIQVVAEATLKAAEQFGEMRKEVLQKCIEKLQSSKSRDSKVTQRLIASLNSQLETCHLVQPATLRSYSASASRQRGGDFASTRVALMRGTSIGAVSEVCSFPPTPQLKRTLPRPNLKKLIQNADSSDSRVDTT